MSCVSVRVSMWISGESKGSFECSDDRIFRSVVLCTTGWMKGREIVSKEAKAVKLRKQAQAYCNRERDGDGSGGERKQKSQTEGQAGT
jgi:hypothetical protein